MLFHMRVNNDESRNRLSTFWRLPFSSSSNVAKKLLSESQSSFLYLRSCNKRFVYGVLNELLCEIIWITCDRRTQPHSIHSLKYTSRLFQFFTTFIQFHLQQRTALCCVCCSTGLSHCTYKSINEKWWKSKKCLCNVTTQKATEAVGTRQQRRRRNSFA